MPHFYLPLPSEHLLVCRWHGSGTEAGSQAERNRREVDGDNFMGPGYRN